MGYIPTNPPKMIGRSRKLDGDMARYYERIAQGGDSMQDKETRRQNRMVLLAVIIVVVALIMAAFLPDPAVGHF